MSSPGGGDVAEIGPVSAFFAAQDARLAALPPSARTLDIASGRGRHSLAAARRGFSVLALDRNAAALETLVQAAGALRTRIECRCVDLEGTAPPDLDAPPFDLILVFRYLHRPLMPWIAHQLAPGGLLLYETFTEAQRDLGWGPSRADFLLSRDELPGLFPALEILDHSEGLSQDAKPAETARLVARRSEAT